VTGPIGTHNGVRMLCTSCGVELINIDVGYGEEVDGRRAHIPSRCCERLVRQLTELRESETALRVILNVAATTVSGMGGTWEHPIADPRDLNKLHDAIMLYRSVQDSLRQRAGGVARPTPGPTPGVKNLSDYDDPAGAA
jgi:hypothetical protein